MKICAMTCLHNLALGMIGGSLDKKRFPRNTVVEQQRKKGRLSKSKAESIYKYFKAGEQVKFGLRFTYTCVRAYVTCADTWSEV